MTLPGEVPYDPGRIHVRDVALVAIHAALLPVALLVPERRWHGLARAVVAPFGRLETPNLRERRGRMRRLVAGHPTLPSVEAIDREALALRVVEVLDGLRAWVGAPWRPDVRLEGGEHLERALAAGRGAILWVGPQMQAALRVKKALSDAGHRVVHMSSPYHGISQTRFGTRFLNRIQIRVEERLVAERIVKHEGFELRATRAATRRLGENRVVTISSVPLGRRLLDCKMLSGRMRVAPGPASLALATGAPLHPVFCEVAESGACTVRIEAALAAPPGLRGRDAVEAMAAAFAARVEAETLRAPASSLIWHYSA